MFIVNFRAIPSLYLEIVKCFVLCQASKSIILSLELALHLGLNDAVQAVPSAMPWKFNVNDFQVA